MSRLMWLLILSSLSAQAQDLQVTWTGSAQTESGTPLGPMSLSFVLDPSTGTQTFTSDGSRLENWSVSGGTLSDFSFSAAGQNIITTPTMTVSYGGSATGDQLSNAIVFGNPSVGVLVFTSLASATPSNAAAIFTTYDWTRAFGTIDDLDLTITSSNVTPVAVAEPGTLSLMALALLVAAAFRVPQLCRPLRLPRSRRAPEAATSGCREHPARQG